LNLDQILLAARIAYRKGDYGGASTLYELASEEGRMDALAILRYASSRLLGGDLDGAIAHFEEGLRLYPGNVGLITHLACAREMQGNDAEAARLYRFVIANTASAGLAFVNLGYILLVHGNMAGAVDCLQRGLEASPSSAPLNFVLPSFRVSALPTPKLGTSDQAASMACLMLGLKLQESGRFPQAQACFAQSLRCNVRNGSAYGALAVAGKLSQRDSSLIERMVALTKARDLDDQTRIRLAFALGKAMDDLGEYASAMAHFEEAHRLSLAQGSAPFDRAAFEAEVSAIIKAYTGERVREEGVSGSEADLPLPIVGMMRSGTTLVEQIVSSHPEVTAGDELCFWRDHGFRQLRSGLRPPTREEASGLAEAYTSMLREIDPDGQRVTDKMPHNFMATGLIHRVFPNARVLCCRRNPVDICLSLYMTDFRHPIPFVNTREDLVFFYRQFERLMDHWHDVTPSDRLIDVSYEELLTNREAATRRLIEFCGLEWDDACLHPENNRRAVKTASVWQVRQQVYSTSKERWRRYEPWLGELQSLLPTA
jgi:tetratricopeptide (TPR) repeat protein